MTKILMFDIETSFAIAATFSLRADYISHKNILQEPYIICASWKWLGEDEVHSVQVSRKECLRQDDKKVVKKLHTLIEEADIIVGHNSDKFDIKWVKGRCLKYGLPPLTFLKTIDTLKVARRNFGGSLLSKRLDYIGTYLGLGNKISTSGGLWLDILQGKQAAIDEMVTYNKQDVVLLEEVYLKLRPYIENFPAVPKPRAIKEDCKACGSTNTQKYGYTFNNAKKIQKHRCNECGSVFKGAPLETLI